MRPATSCARDGSEPSDASRCVRTMRSAPPSRSSVSSRSSVRPVSAAPRPTGASARAAGTAPRCRPAVVVADGDACRRPVTPVRSSPGRAPFRRARLDLDLVARTRQQRVPVLERAVDRLARRVPVEVLEPQQVIERVPARCPSKRSRSRARPRGSRAGSARQGRACEAANVSSVDASCRPSARGRRTAPRTGRGRAATGPPTRSGHVVENIDERPVRAGSARSRRSASFSAASGSSRLQPREARPAATAARCGRRRSRAPHRSSLRSDSRMQQRALADAARAVEHRDPIRAEVVARRSRPLVAAEEPLRVRLRVRDEALVRGRRVRGLPRRRERPGSCELSAHRVDPLAEVESEGSRFPDAPRTCRRSRLDSSWIDQPPVLTPCSDQICRRITRRFQSRMRVAEEEQVALTNPSHQVRRDQASRRSRRAR